MKRNCVINGKFVSVLFGALALFFVEPALSADASHAPVATEQAADPLADHAAAHAEATAEHGGGTDGHAGEAGEHGTGHGSGGLPQLNPASFPSQIFWLVITFAIMFVFLSRMILPNIGGVLKKRETHIRSTLDAAKRQKEVAEGLQSEYERDIENARLEATGAFTGVEREIKERADAEYRSFQERAAGQIQATEKEIQKAKAAAMEDMQHLAAEIASQAAEKIIGVETDINEAKTVVRSLKAKAA